MRGKQYLSPSRNWINTVRYYTLLMALGCRVIMKLDIISTFRKQIQESKLISKADKEAKSQNETCSTCWPSALTMTGENKGSIDYLILCQTKYASALFVSHAI